MSYQKHTEERTAANGEVRRPPRSDNDSNTKRKSMTHLELDTRIRTEKRPREAGMTITTETVSVKVFFDEVPRAEDRAFRRRTLPPNVRREYIPPCRRSSTDIKDEIIFGKAWDHTSRASRELDLKIRDALSARDRSVERKPKSKKSPLMQKSIADFKKRMSLGRAFPGW